MGLRNENEYRMISFIFILLFTIILPFFIRPIIWLVTYIGSAALPDHIQHVFGLFSIDFSSYLTIFGIEATVLIAIMIYVMQKRTAAYKEKLAIIEARRSLFLLLITALQRIFDAYYAFQDEKSYENRLVNIPVESMLLLSKIDRLSDENLIFTHDLLNLLKNVYEKNENKELEININDYNVIFKMVAKPAYYIYANIIKEPNTIYEIMNRQILEVLNQLGSDFSFKESKNSHDAEGRIIINYEANGKAKIFTEQNSLICNAFLTNKGIHTGWATIFDGKYTSFQGEFQEYNRSGYGREYFITDNPNEIFLSKDGEWENNQLINGHIYDVLVNDSGEPVGKTIIQINENFLDEIFPRLEYPHTEYKTATLQILNRKVKDIDNKSYQTVKDAYERKYGKAVWVWGTDEDMAELMASDEEDLL